MKASHLLFAVVTLLMLGLTAVMGMMVDGSSGYARHVMLGVLAGLFTCFVHVVFFMFFVVQDKIIGQSILHHGIDVARGGQIRRLKSASLRWSMIGIGSILLTAATGAMVDAGGSDRIHLLIAFGTIAIQAVTFYRQQNLLGEHRVFFLEALGE